VLLKICSSTTLNGDYVDDDRSTWSVVVGLHKDASAEQLGEVVIV
jgi:hypothetical protein